MNTDIYYTLWERTFKNACKFYHRFCSILIANVDFIEILSNNEYRRTEYCLVKCFYFAVTYNVAADIDSVGPSFKDRYNQLCWQCLRFPQFFRQVKRYCLKMNYRKICAWNRPWSLPHPTFTVVQPYFITCSH